MATQTATSTIPPSLRDYHLQLTGSNEGLPVKMTRPRVMSNNPPHWPVNKHLDLSERPNGASTPEWVFVNVMLNGVRLNSLFVTSYESTVGRLYPKLTRYEIGGEW
ncbi:hypothetical protein BO78DRAFT_419972 [Aspergillus sclerotiicarbonarius CBS 121057]|uniref:Uncharacterized protein n=1 Tax=Aspergillus sclerotiicarbonarius (strain CBS 121057 / IBT 28362) TaxID=1448318 RepID=A0A319FEQ8_ASPSB|nr:hypothetical protein BO78DRAFT_419972 [Aspergillus sclerotiicarbonarius CBS 121057]